MVIYPGAPALDLVQKYKIKFLRSGQIVAKKNCPKINKTIKLKLIKYDNDLKKGKLTVFVKNMNFVWQMYCKNIRSKLFNFCIKFSRYKDSPKRHQNVAF